MYELSDLSHRVFANSTPRAVLFIYRIDGITGALPTFISTAATSVVR